MRQFLDTRSEEAFLELYRTKTPHLYQMALRLTRDPDQSEELVQEMWIIAIKKLSDFQWRSELKTWLIGILINLHRSMKKQIDKEALIIEDHIITQSKPIYPVEPHTDLEVAISKLPSGYRQIIILHDIEGYKHKEIAEILDISIGTSKSQLFHARKTLREYFTEDKNNEGDG